MDWPAEPPPAGAGPRLPRTSGRVVKLTPAEAAVAAAVAQGLSNREIAVQLGKCEGTVKNQLGSIYRKLAVRNRPQLIVLLRR